MKHLKVLLAAAGIVAMVYSTPAQDHGHLNVGAEGTNQNDALLFDEAAIFDIATNYVKTLTHTNGGRFAGYFQGNITLTALASTVGHPAYSPAAAAPGAWIFAELTSVTGPAGGAFAFWESGATNPTISLASGSTGTNGWRLSETGGDPGTDPYGHIHGRRFTASLPGVYTVGFRALDYSTNGTGGAPIHSPSVELKIYFEAGVNIKSIEPDVDHTHVTFAAPSGNNWVVQAAGSFGTNVSWTTISAPVAGDDYFHQITDDQPVEGQRFYRLKAE